MRNFKAFHGMITMIDDFMINATGEDAGCYKLMSVEDKLGNVVNFVITPTTYFVDHVMVFPGNLVTGFYDANAAVPLIFPPQYRAIVVAIDTPYRNVKVDYFNNQLVSSDNQLKLNLAPHTPILLENGQVFTRSPANRDLIVVYGATTRSIPAQTSPYQVVVMC